ncbi:MAG: DNA-processing protein DprA [Alphaproteobacteria bacterium]|nr:DNA-processing protein DprA [Alphaproteobacteria bacterium]MDA8003515.1 DNA-processing protein DprA [Alphaproteobacteria bacterium]MDA8005551.1 DNA-processing protein DprA [Alphaproteobacteria bacterium]MDA8012704.1 DNA-processing protein DprA [Alphaproteobacteria bacterium]
MRTDPQTHAVMLLTVSLGKAEGGGVRPLSVKEWARFAAWLKDHDLEPAALLAGGLGATLRGWTDRSITPSRLESLLSRGRALGLALEKWRRAGLWAVTRSDAEYPRRLKRRLRLESPPVLFGCGDRALLERGGVAIVGSRDADAEDLAVAGDLAATAVRQGHAVVSGAARGVDMSAMRAALAGGGGAIGVMANGLLRAATAAENRECLLGGALALVTPFNPEAGFNAGNAMARNRYIYCLADAAVVVSSAANAGGTWSGAIEDLAAGWVPLWVRRSTGAGSGNADLVRRGARWLPDDPGLLSDLLDGAGGGGGGDLPLLEGAETI